MAAAPTFAAMALWSLLAPSRMAVICSTSDRLPLGDMTVMYLLMAAFHASPWLDLVFRRHEPENAG